MNNEIFAHTVKSLRNRLNLSRAELAEKCKTTHTSIGRWETGEAMPGLDKAFLLAKALGVTIYELMGEKEPQEEKPAPKDNTLDQIKELLANKKPDSSHIPEEFLNLAKNLPLSAKDNWESVIDHLNFEIEEYQTELENGPRQYVTKEDIVKKEQEALSRPRLSDPLAVKHKL